jgi:GNAT superfamily N-acetyltransferase
MTLRVEQVEGRTGIAQFIDVAWKVHAGRGTQWIPPLRAMVKDGLDRKGNPFYREADRALFVAHRDGAAVGRVAAVENRWHNRHHGDRVGFFGFFECLDDEEAARELLSTAERWLRERGLDVVRGPMSPSMNHECGLLVDGFETPPVMMTPWNPPYYGRLIEGAGYAKVQDLLAYWIPAGDKLAVPDRVRKLAERAIRSTRVTFRTLDVGTLERKVLDLYNEAWSGNWGFVPPSWDEFWHTAKDLKSVLAAEFSFVAEIDDEIVGFMLIARDINKLLRDMPSGRLWPANIARLVLGVKNVMRGRVVLLGLRTEYRNRGLFPLFAYEAARRALEIRAEGAEASWILDDNEALVAPLDAMGLAAYKRWRIYQKS